MPRRTPTPGPPLDDTDDLCQGFAPTCSGCLHPTEPFPDADPPAWHCPRCATLVTV